MINLLNVFLPDFISGPQLLRGTYASHVGLPWWLSSEESTCNGVQETSVHPWAREIPWRRAWQPTPVFLENPMDRGAWQAVCGVAKSQTRLKQLSTRACHVASHSFLMTTFL